MADNGTNGAFTGQIRRLFGQGCSAILGSGSSRRLLYKEIATAEYGPGARLKVN